MNPARPDRGGFEDPGRLESGGGGLVASTHDYARFCQMMLNKGEIAGKRILKPETIALMTRNHIGDLHVGVDGTRPQPGGEAGALRARLRGPTPTRKRQACRLAPAPTTGAARPAPGSGSTRSTTSRSSA